VSYLERQIRRLSATWDRVGLASSHDVIWHQGGAVSPQACPPPPPPVSRARRLPTVEPARQGTTDHRVLDWELCTLGDPLADLAWLLDDWRQPEDEAISMPSPTRAGGSPTGRRWFEEYCRETGSVSIESAIPRFLAMAAAPCCQGVLAVDVRCAGTHGQLDLNLLEHSIATLLTAAAVRLLGFCSRSPA